MLDIITIFFGILLVFLGFYCGSIFTKSNSKKDERAEPLITREELVSIQSIPQLIENDVIPVWMVKQLKKIQDMPEGTDSEVCIKAHCQGYWFKLILDYVDGLKSELDVRREMQNSKIS